MKPGNFKVIVKTLSLMSLTLTLIHNGIANAGEYYRSTYVSYFNGNVRSDALGSGTSGDGRNFKLAVTAAQMSSLNHAGSYLSGHLFIGEKIRSFGDTGMFVQAAFPSDDDKTNVYMTGLQLAPSLDELLGHRLFWGSVLWSTKLGYGFGSNRRYFVVGTGLILEPGSFLHMSIEVLHGVTAKTNAEKFPTAVVFGLGFHFD